MATTGAGSMLRDINARRRSAISYLQIQPWRYGLFVMVMALGATWLWRWVNGDRLRWIEAIIWAVIFFVAGTVTAVRRRTDAAAEPATQRPPNRRV